VIRKVAGQPSSSFQGWLGTVCVSITFRLVCSGTFVAEFQEDIRIIIRDIVECLQHSVSDIGLPAIELLSRLAVLSMCSESHHFLVGVLKYVSS